MKSVSEVVKLTLKDLGYHDLDMNKSLVEHGVDSLDITEIGMYIETELEDDVLIEFDLSYGADFAASARSQTLGEFIITVERLIADKRQQQAMIGYTA